MASIQVVHTTAPLTNAGEIMTKVAGTKPFLGSFKAVAAVLAVTLLVGAGASHALVSTGSRSVATNAATGQSIVFTDARRLPLFDNAGPVAQPLAGFATAAEPVLASAR